jgi:hypothetical protein
MVRPRPARRWWRSETANGTRTGDLRPYGGWRCESAECEKDRVPDHPHEHLAWG